MTATERAQFFDEAFLRRLDQLELASRRLTAGRMKGGRHLRFPKDTPMNNLHLAMLEKVGVPVEKLGDSNGRIDLEPLAGV